MNLMETECQELADKYCMAIKEIRLIRRTDPAPLIITPTRKPELMAVPFQNLPFNREFQDFTKKYCHMVQEVRVIYFNGCGAAQFFPPGTPDRVVLTSNVPPEELKP
jgi:hypothetical protein